MTRQEFFKHVVSGALTEHLNRELRKLSETRKINEKSTEDLFKFADACKDITYAFATMQNQVGRIIDKRYSKLASQVKNLKRGS